jgi:hypothetical protein
MHFDPLEIAYALTALDAYCAAKHYTPFDALDEDTQNEALADLFHGLRQVAARRGTLPALDRTVTDPASPVSRVWLVKPFREPVVQPDEPISFEMEWQRRRGNDRGPEGA